MFEGAKKFLRDLRKRCTKPFVSGNRNTDELPQQIETITTRSYGGTTGATTAGYNDYVVYGSNGPAVTTESYDRKKDERIEKKPVEVVNEILAEIPAMNMTDLKGQLKLIEKRLNTLKKLGSSASQEEEVIRYLKARMKFIKHGAKFGWVTTNDALIEKLCKTYKLQKVGFASYARNVPAEAIDEIEKFIDALEVIDKKAKPEFSLIIDEGGKEQRKDPILLARSPFGRWYYMLGAWDEPVEVIDAIIYNGK